MHNSKEQYCHVIYLVELLLNCQVICRSLKQLKGRGGILLEVSDSNQAQLKQNKIKTNGILLNKLSPQTLSQNKP